MSLAVTEIAEKPVQHHYHKYSSHKSREVMDEQEKIAKAQRHKKLLRLVAISRDKTAFANLFADFAPQIRAFGNQRLGSQAAALDLLQETMTSVWTKAHLFDPDKGAVSTWIFTIMRNQCFDMLRRVQHCREDAYGDDIWPLFENPDAGDGMQDHKMSNKLLQCLDYLPPQQKQIVESVYLQDISQQELAERLDIPIGTVKSRLRLGLEKLKSFLEKHHD